MKKLYTLSLLIASCVAVAQASDNFPASEATAINTTVWTTHSGTAGQMITVGGGSLSYPGLTSSGNRTQIAPGNTEDVNLPSLAPITGAAYYSAVINVLSTDGLALNTDATGNYFLMFGSTAGTGVTVFNGRIYVKAGATAGTYNLGILNGSGGTATPTFSATNYAINVTSFVVVKFDFATNTASLFVNPTIGGTEGTATVTNATGTTAAPAQIASLAIREAGNATAGTGNIDIDSVRLGGTYAYVTSSVLGTQQNSISGLQVYPNPVTNGNLFITSDNNASKAVAIYDVLGKLVIKTTITDQAVNVSNLKGGVYIVKITEEGKTATRKLVIR